MSCDFIFSFNAAHRIKKPLESSLESTDGSEEKSLRGQNRYSIWDKVFIWQAANWVQNMESGIIPKTS